MCRTASQHHCLDLREQLFNDRQVGPAHEIARPRENITRLHGILQDLDPKYLLPGNPYFPPAEDAKEFLAGITPALNRHPLAQYAEIRASGTGLHAIVRMDPPAELHTHADQEHWAAVVTAVQLSLPGDDHAPGITALTRPIGSTNSKNGATVRQLRAGKPVSPDVVLNYVAALDEAPFRRLVEALIGPMESVRPCPICRAEGSSMAVFDRAGKCYGCGKVTWDMLIDQIVAPAEIASTPKARRGRSAAATNKDPQSTKSKPSDRPVRARAGKTTNNKHG